MYTVVPAPVAESPVAPAVVKPSTYKLTSAAAAPSTLATVILFIFKILSASTVTKVVVAVADRFQPRLPPRIFVTDTILGFAINFLFPIFYSYPKIIAIAIAFPVVIPKVDVAVHPRVPDPSVVTKAVEVAPTAAGKVTV